MTPKATIVTKEFWARPGQKELGEITESPRHAMHQITVGERVGNFKEVAPGYTFDDMTHESDRCLSCGCLAFHWCDLRLLSEEYDADLAHFKGYVRKHKIDERHPYLVYDPNKCILCARCIRTCDRILSISALGLINRGFSAEMRPAMNDELPDTTRIACGNCVDACEAVHHAHRHGVVHRDLKPSNILVEEGPEGKDRVYVVDFGIALSSGDVDMTMTGQVLGTPGYMAPEQARGKRDAVDRRCDVFSLGVILYEMLTEHRPFPGDNAGDVFLQLFEGDPTPPRRHRASVSTDIETIVMTCLSREPAKRYDSVRALVEDLERYLDGMPVVARPVGPLTRLVRRARCHPKVATALVVAAASTLLAVADAVRASWSGVARARAAQQFGQEVERIDALLRHAHMAPLHDVRAEHEVVRQRMRRIEAERQRLGRLAEGPGDYALGRAYLSLGEHRAAREPPGSSKSRSPTAGRRWRRCAQATARPSRYRS